MLKTQRVHHASASVFWSLRCGQILMETGLQSKVVRLDDDKGRSVFSVKPALFGLRLSSAQERKKPAPPIISSV